MASRQSILSQASSGNSAAAPAPKTDTIEIDDVALALTTFVGNLDTARQLWRRYPSLVEADKLPEPFASAERDSGAPDDEDTDYSDGDLRELNILPPIERRASKSPELQDVIRTAAHAADRHGAALLVRSTRENFELFLKNADALDLYLADDILNDAWSGGSLMEAIFNILRLERPWAQDASAA